MKNPSLLEEDGRYFAEKALDEAKAAIDKVLAGAGYVELTPQNTQIRKLQHELVEQHNLESKSVGEGESRHLRIVGGKDFNQRNGFKEA
jgi:predicted RNA-binding protein Jag